MRATDKPRELREPADPRRWKALTVICTAQLMLMLDLTVINVALPDLGADLGLSRGAFTWLVSVYTLFLGGQLLLGGRLADVFGARSMILTGLAVFILASLVNGLAQNENLLIGGRLCQGIGAAVLSPAALRALTGIFHAPNATRRWACGPLSAASASPSGCSPVGCLPAALAGAGFFSSIFRSVSSLWSPSGSWC